MAISHRLSRTAGAALAAVSLAVSDTGTGHAGTLESDGVRVVWRHSGDRLTVTVSAPTRGWVAVGFNDRRRLRDTRFVMAAATSPPRFEEHVALVPDHMSVEDLGLTMHARFEHAGYDDGRTTVVFSVPHRFTDRPSLALGPGRSVHLMVAWSQHADFGHHSAWRRHFDVVL